MHAEHVPLTIACALVKQALAEEARESYGEEYGNAARKLRHIITGLSLANTERANEIARLIGAMWTATSRDDYDREHAPHRPAKAEIVAMQKAFSFEINRVDFPTLEFPR